MKTKLIKLITTGVLALGLMALVSCQARTVTHVPGSAVSCTKCGTVWFKAPYGGTAGGGGANMAGGKGYLSLRTASQMECPDCENTIVGWVKTGTFTRHTCASCGGTMYHCIKH